MTEQRRILLSLVVEMGVVVVGAVSGTEGPLRLSGTFPCKDPRCEVLLFRAAAAFLNWWVVTQIELWSCFDWVAAAWWPVSQIYCISKENLVKFIMMNIQFSSVIAIIYLLDRNWAGLVFLFFVFLWNKLHCDFMIKRKRRLRHDWPHGNATATFLFFFSSPFYHCINPLAVFLPFAQRKEKKNAALPRSWWLHW